MPAVLCRDVTTVDTDGRRPTVTATTADHDSVVRAVVDVVAAVENEPPTSLPPLADVVDPDALNELVGAANSDVRVGFDYAGHRLVATPATVECY